LKRFPFPYPSFSACKNIENPEEQGFQTWACGKGAVVNLFIHHSKEPQEREKVVCGVSTRRCHSQRAFCRLATSVSLMLLVLYIYTYTRSASGCGAVGSERGEEKERALLSVFLSKWLISS